MATHHREPRHPSTLRADGRASPRVEWIDAKSALTETSGFLGGAGTGGFTHSFSPAIGCSLGGTACGIACYAQFLQPHRVRAAPTESWGDVVRVKRNAPEVLRSELQRASRRDPAHRHHVERLRVFSASGTEPLAGPCLPIYRECLRVLAGFPVGGWALQTRSPLVARLARELASLGDRLVVSLTLETDDDAAFDLGHPGSPTIAARRRAVESLSREPVLLHVAVSPCLPVRDTESFARWLAAHTDVVTVDTFVAGDGTGRGARTARTEIPALLARRGVDWRDDGPALRLLDRLRALVGDRAGWSHEGFLRLADPRALPRRPRP